MNVMSRVISRRLAAATAASFVVAGATVALTGIAQASTVLSPDPVAYCETSLPYGMQTAVNGWGVQYDQLLGDSYQNNWRCEYWVSATVPVASEEGEDDFTLPPVAQSIPVDWNAMCGQQFPGSWATWIPGPETDATGAPWGCQAPAGVTYDPAENSSGVHAVTSG
jgi:hypothetical protein